jgi:hypothetical protein
MDYCWLVRNESLNRDFSTISPKIDTLKISECKNRNDHYIYDDGNTVPSSGQAQHGGGVKQINAALREQGNHNLNIFYIPTHTTLWLSCFLLYTIGNINCYISSHTPSFVCVGGRVARSLVLYVCFVDRCLSFCTFYFGHCIVCSSIYGFWWLPICSLQTFHMYENKSQWSNYSREHQHGLYKLWYN